MTRLAPEDLEASPLDQAARAAWLYYVGGMRQDRVAEELGISRQRAQRLVARAMAEGLVRVRIDHPITACMELEARLKTRFGLARVRVAPDAGAEAQRAIVPVAAAELDAIFAGERSLTIALGTGRTLRAVIDAMQNREGRHHRLVSLIGNVSPDGSASFYEVIMRLADRVGAPHFPMAAPVMARDAEELALYRGLPHVRTASTVAEAADLTIVGIGQMGDDAPLYVDGFLTRETLEALQDAGAAGEICGHVFDAQGRYFDPIPGYLPVGRRASGRVLCIGGGPVKLAALAAALRGELITDLVTDEITARALLA
ncbi:sugar-binding transcriptional regulator [Roseivivax sp. CAU 1761]